MKVGFPPTPSAEPEEGAAQREFAPRLLMVAVLTALFGASILLRLTVLLLSPDRQRLIGMAEERRTVRQVVHWPRGLIYDASGNLLAGIQVRYEVSVQPALIPDRAAFADTVAPILGKGAGEVAALLTEHASPWVSLATGLTADQVALLQKTFGQPEWLTVSSTPVRFYPEGPLASNVLGFVTAKDQWGVFGVEQWYDAILRPPAETMEVPRDPFLAGQMELRVRDRHLVLTIPRALQAEVEDLLDEYVEQTKAEGGAVVVLDVETGAVLAMASSPRPDLNDYEQAVAFGVQSSGFNRAIDTPYEPGSVFKVLVMAAALDAGVVEADSEYEDTGVEGGWGGPPVYNWDRQGHGTVSMQACLQYSLNTCMAWIAKQFPSDDAFYAYLQAFGIGQATGVDLAGEKTGSLPRPGIWWSRSDRVRQGFGQAVSTTPLQMAVAAAALANGGYLMTPYVVQEVWVDGAVYRHEPQVVRKVVSDQVSRTITQWLVPWDDGEAVKGRLPGYALAGKTGTAEVALPGKGYNNALSNASYVGWLPADRPQVVIYVWLEQPKTSRWASIVAAPLFRQVAERVVVHLGIPPDKVRHALLETGP